MMKQIGTIEGFLATQRMDYLKMCFDELESFRETGVLPDGEISQLNARFFNNSSTTVYTTISKTVYREIAKRHFIK